MRPILMKGHERPLTYLKYNKEGDLLFSCALDRSPAVWYADSGELLGTYPGHTGAVWGCDISGDSKLLITASAGQSKLWDVQTGAHLFTFRFESTAKSVEFSVGHKLAVIATDSFNNNRLPSAIHVKRIASDPTEQCDDSVVEFSPGGRSNRAVWGPLNRTIITGGEDGVLRVWDVEKSALIHESDKETGHQKAVTSLSKSVDGSQLLTSSTDKSAKLWDIRSMKLVRTYNTDSPVNAAALSPLLDHVVLGGGQEASTVTIDPRAGKFEAKFFDKVLAEEIGAVKGHFGPINALAFNPDGRSFASGGEDGYVRLHHFDQDYFNIAI